MAAACLAVPLFTVAVSTPAAAQANESVHQFQRRQWQRMQEQRGGFFGLFGGGWNNRREPTRRYRAPAEPQRQVDYSHAPPPRKKEGEPDPNRPITDIVVMGGSMADWLAYGLEDAFSDSPNVEIVRKDQPNSGLLRYKYKSDLDWWHVAREELAQQKANFVVMMLGVLDRQNIRESDVEQEPANTDQAKTGGAQTADQAKDKTKDKPKPKPAKNGVLAFRSEQWQRVYTRRIDETLAALKSRGVPVFWVGLPSIRGTRSTADAVYLNNLYRARAERAGVVYVDVWDGFVDEAGKYSSFGPDYEGQTRHLRSRDGVFFTKYGARKLAHYVEREIRRYMTNRVTTLNLPTAPFGPGAGTGQPNVRPLAGPVLPLTGTVGTTDVLLGGANARPARADEVASGVLVKGNALNAPAGRADDFKWPPDGQDYGKPPAPPPPPAADKTSKAAPAAAPGLQVIAPATIQPAADNAAAQAKAKAEADAKAQEQVKQEQAKQEQAKADAEAKAKAEEDARLKAETEAKQQAAAKARAEAQRRAAERARAQAQRSAQRRQEWFRPPGRIEPRRQQPRRRSDDPFRDLFGLLPR